MTDTPVGGEARFPCASLADALAQLRRPPSAVAVRFKIQTAAADAAQVAAYVDARFVYDRLDQVCGAHWSARFAPLPKPMLPRPPGGCPPAPLHVRCRLTLFDVGREDVGEGTDPKAAWSDAVKRAAVHFGVGRSLYAMRLPWLRAGEADGELRRDVRGEMVLDTRTEAWCREKYERWLAERGVRKFGEPLDHASETGPAGPQQPPVGGESSQDGRSASSLRAAA